jgi:hypothetical protein
MNSFRSKPTGWQKDNHRHYLAAKYGTAGGKVNSMYRLQGTIEHHDGKNTKIAVLVPQTSADKARAEKFMSDLAKKSDGDAVIDQVMELNVDREKERLPAIMVNKGEWRKTSLDPNVEKDVLNEGKYYVSKESVVEKGGVKFKRYDIEDPEMASKQIEFTTKGKGNRVLVADKDQGWTASMNKGLVDEPVGEKLPNLYGRAESEEARRQINRARYKEARGYDSLEEPTQQEIMEYEQRIAQEQPVHRRVVKKKVEGLSKADQVGKALKNPFAENPWMRK